MSIEIPPYYIYSTIAGEQRLGVFDNTAPPGAPQPVVLGGDSFNWWANPENLRPGPTQLRVAPYLYTKELEGDVVANNLDGREWFLIQVGPEPERTFRIAFDPQGTSVWTVTEPGRPIRIEPLVEGDPRQVFKFVLNFP